MRLRNSEGTPVDPVPFYVVSAMTFLVCFSFGPLYGAALGASIRQAAACSAVVFAGVTAGAYHRLIRQARPDSPPTPAHLRIRHLVYVTAALVGVLVLLALPLL